MGNLNTAFPGREAGAGRAAAAGSGPADHDLLAALASEYEELWKVWKPGRYVADHRRLDVSLKSDSVSGLAEKLRAFTELVKDLPGTRERGQVQ